MTNKQKQNSHVKMQYEMRRSHCSSPFIYDAEGFPIPGHCNRDGNVKACTRTSSCASSYTCTRAHCLTVVLWDACPWCRSLASARCPSWCSCRLDVRQHQGRAGRFRPTLKALRRVETRWAGGSSLELPEDERTLSERLICPTRTTTSSQRCVQ